MGKWLIIFELPSLKESNIWKKKKSCLQTDSIARSSKAFSLFSLVTILRYWLVPTIVAAILER